MDSLTQFALGAGVGAAVFGRRIGPRPAALMGGALGTLPDLDVFLPYADAVAAFVYHRAATHSLLVQAAATPLVAEAALRLFRGLRGARARTYLGIYLIFATHALLDAMTVYGTRIFWPLWPDPVGLGSVFIIDPVYTLPLLVALLWALCLRSWTKRFGRALALCLVLSSAYLAWTPVGQAMALARGQAFLDRAGVAPDRMLATPTPFNALAWRIIAVDGDRYFNIYIPLHAGDDAVTAYVHPRGTLGAACRDVLPAAQRLTRFTKGFFRMERLADGLAVADLRMGLTPNYVFRFRVAAFADGRAVPVRPTRVAGTRNADGDFPWLFGLLAGDPVMRPAEAAGRVRDVEALKAALRAPAAAPAPTC